jgi:hypothetical protein
MFPFTLPLGDESLFCIPTTYPSLYPQPHNYGFFPSPPVFSSLETTKDECVIDISSTQNNKRRAFNETEEGVRKRSKIAYNPTTPDQTPNPFQPCPTTIRAIPSYSIRGRNKASIAPPLRLEIPTPTNTEPTTSLNTEPGLDPPSGMAGAIVETRKALTAMGRALSSRDGVLVEKYLLVAIETLET